MKKFFLIDTISFPRVVLDVILESVELGVELVLKLTDELQILSEVKSVQIKRLGEIDVSQKHQQILLLVDYCSTGDNCEDQYYGTARTLGRLQKMQL